MERTTSPSRFQFHKGTIKTILRRRCLPMHTYFNSIKVRLKHWFIENEGIEHQFQFHKGTIKTCVRSSKPRRAGVFQFHKGTIKTA